MQKLMVNSPLNLLHIYSVMYFWREFLDGFLL